MNDPDYAIQKPKHILTRTSQSDLIRKIMTK